eukprot:scaffold4672_cov78-Skeletonema_dohrnii-CCMP3373.AAC.2
MSSFRHNSSLLAASENNNNIVTIDLSHHPPNGKLGMLLAPGSLPTPISSSVNSTSSTTQNAAAALPTASNVTLVAGWEHGNNQQLGPIQRSGMVRLGDRLVRINGRDVTDWTFREVMDVLKEMITATHQTTTATTENTPKHKRKKKLNTLGFAPSGTDEWSRGVIVGGEEFNSSSMLFGLFQSQDSKMSPHVISKSKYSFVSFVGRWRVVDESVTDVAAASQAATTRSTVGKGIEQPQQDNDRQQQQQQRQISENSTDLLEEQLNKEPSMKFDSDGKIDIPEHDDEHHDETTDNQQQSPKQAATTTPSIFSSEAEAEWHKEITEFQQKNPPQPKKIVQYEIQCHLLLRDPNSFKSSSNNHNTSHHHHHGIINKNTIHHSWSVWKRYSEFQSLDTELRHTFGWQMDATDDGKGIVFPGVHGLESWWYGWRNGGGYLTSLMGGSYGVEVDNDGDARVDEEADNGNKKEKRKKTADKDSNGRMFGFFSNTNATTEPAAATSSTSAHRNHDEDSNNRASISSSTSTSKPCPYPKPFIEKRQKELTAYWRSLSRVEDIFEFSDVNSHRFGTLMASFLEVDQVLLSRRSNSRATAGAGTGAGAGAGTASNQQRYHQPTSPSRLTVPVIHEDETELYSFGARKSEQWLSPMTPAREFSGITFNDDDVSMLSDGTGANAYLTNLQNNPSPVPPGRRLLVDNVPAQFTSNNPLPRTAENRSVSSRSTKRGGGRGASRRPKPAFQRQFMD